MKSVSQASGSSGGGGGGGETMSLVDAVKQAKAGAAVKTTAADPEDGLVMETKLKIIEILQVRLVRHLFGADLLDAHVKSFLRSLLFVTVFFCSKSREPHVKCWQNLPWMLVFDFIV